MRARILPTHTPALFQTAVDEAVAILRAGGVVALPTETVYGLAANALNPSSVRCIFTIKGRPSNNPLIVHVASGEGAMQCAASWPDAAQRLASAFWPGPLSLVVPAAPVIPAEVTAGGTSVAIRWPQHPLMQSVIRAAGFPLAAPSANLSNRLSPTLASHVAAQLGDQLDIIVDGGACNVGIESTVVDVRSHNPVILRPGIISEPAIQAALGKSVAIPDSPSPISDPHRALPSPGMLAKHYSPRAQLRIAAWNSDRELDSIIASLSTDPSRIRILSHRNVPVKLSRPSVVHFIPDDPEAYARALYAELHDCDATGVDFILVERPPNDPPWSGVLDRLKRASSVP